MAAAKKVINTAVGLDRLIAQLNARDSQLAGRGTDFIERTRNRTPISTGLITVDYLFSGGLARGRITLLFGQPGAGKSSLAISTMAAAQAAGLKVALIDTEGTNADAVGMDYLELLGVNTQELLTVQPLTFEQAIEAAAILAADDEIDLIVIDSGTGAPPKRLYEQEEGKSIMGLKASRAGELVARCNPLLVRQGKAMLILTHETKTSMDMYGTDTAAGGKDLKHYSSLHARLTKSRKVNDGNEVGTRDVELHVNRTKMGGIEGASTEMLFRFGIGFDVYFDLIEAGKKFGIINERGAGYFDFLGKTIHGKKAFMSALQLDSAMFVELYGTVRAKMHASLLEEKEQAKALTRNLRALIGQSHATYATQQ